MRRAIITIAAAVALAALAGCGDDRQNAISEYGGRAMSSMEAHRQSLRVCRAEPMGLACDDAKNEDATKAAWLAESREEIGKLNPPITNAERLEVREHWLGVANWHRSEYSPPYTYADLP